eukprot:CAMPEP_0176420078 /NCGR_PEP_ID=MMETSP0127-20121128/8405_1 /TAXON_ID=938130 /ORGANISM="Platyophrya macrostoma, Strain WH" /LENGTH=149 /DNA_ID=CAMNT_0017800631 /DNA_START=44 /DNA_END=493 /DNA_ORIENTATION=-
MDSKLIPNKLLSDAKGTTTSDNSGFADTKIKALYFSASWCPPCHKFTPFLATLYNEVNKKNKELEIIFVSFDKKKSEFESYYKKMPWLAIPFEDKDTIKKLSSKYSVQGIPTLLILDNNGEVLVEDGYLELAQSTDPIDVVNTWKSYYD